MNKIIYTLLIIHFSLLTVKAQEGWVLQYSNNAVDFTRIYMSDSLNGWTIGYDSVFYTTNGGQNWISRNIGYEGIEDVYFLNADTGWMITSDYIIKTTNGGQNWIMQCYGPTQFRILFVDENTGFTIGGSQIFRYTINGGNNWITQYFTTNYELFSIDFINRDTGWIGGDDGFLLKTTNCGLNWIQKNTGTDTRLYGISFPSKDTGWAGGFNDFGISRVLFTSNGGENWEVKYNDPVSQGVENLFFISPKEGWAVGAYGKIMHTVNAGNNWDFQVSGVSVHLFSVFFLTRELGWTVGEIGGANGKILKTTTGGLVPISNITEVYPKYFRLKQNYPNPFNSSTIIYYELPVDCKVTINIYNALGESVQCLLNQYQQEGKYKIIWDASNFSSGLYFYMLRTENYTETKKFVLIK